MALSACNHGELPEAINGQLQLLFFSLLVQDVRDLIYDLMVLDVRPFGTGEDCKAFILSCKRANIELKNAAFRHYRVALYQLQQASTMKETISSFSPTPNFSNLILTIAVTISHAEPTPYRKAFDLDVNLPDADPSPDQMTLFSTLAKLHVGKVSVHTSTKSAKENRGAVMMLWHYYSLRELVRACEKDKQGINVAVFEFKENANGNMQNLPKPPKSFRYELNDQIKRLAPSIPAFKWPLFEVMHSCDNTASLVRLTIPRGWNRRVRPLTVLLRKDPGFIQLQERIEH